MVYFIKINLDFTITKIFKVFCDARLKILKVYGDGINVEWLNKFKTVFKIKITVIVQK